MEEHANLALANSRGHSEGEAASCAMLGDEKHGRRNAKARTSRFDK